MSNRLGPSELIQLWQTVEKGRTEDMVVCFGNKIIDYCLATSNRVPIARMGLDVRTSNALRRAGYMWADQLDNLSIKQLEAIPNIGQLSASQIMSYFDSETLPTILK